MKNLLIVNDNTEVDKSFSFTKEGEATFDNIGPAGATEVAGNKTTFNLKRKTVNTNTEVVEWIVEADGPFAVFVDNTYIPHIFTHDKLPTFFREGNKYKIIAKDITTEGKPRYQILNADYDNSHEVRFVKLKANESVLENITGGTTLDSLGTEIGTKLKPSIMVTCFGALSYTGYQGLSGTWDLEVNGALIVTNANILELRNHFTGLGIKAYVVNLALEELSSESILTDEEFIKLQNTTESSMRIRLIPNTNAIWRLPIVTTIGAITNYQDNFVSICLAPTLPPYANDENFFTAYIDTTGSPSYYMQSEELGKPDIVFAENVNAWLEARGFEYNENQLIVNVSNERKWLRIESTNNTQLTGDGERDDTALSFVDYTKTCMEGYVAQSFLDVPTNYSWDLVDKVDLNLTTDLNLRRYLLIIDKLPVGDTLNYLSMSEIISLLAAKNITCQIIDDTKLYIGIQQPATTPAMEIAIMAPGYALAGTFGTANTNGFLIENPRDALLFGIHESIYTEALATSIYDIPFIIDESILAAAEGYLVGSSVTGMATLFKFKMAGINTLSDLYNKFVEVVDPLYFNIGVADYTETGKLKFTLTSINLDIVGVLSFQFIGPKDQPILENVLTTEVSTSAAISSKYGFVINADYLA